MATLLFYLTAACFIGTSLAAPSSPPDAQLNGVSGPYFDGVEGADRAEVAGLLATLVFKSEDDITSGDVDDMAPRSELSLFVVMNEYKNDRLIRQSQCFQDLEHGVPHLQTSCTATIGFPMVEGDLDVAALQQMLKEYLVLVTKPEYKQRVERRETMKLSMENVVDGFSFSVQSDRSTTSESIFLGKGEDLHEVKVTEGVYDLIWEPKQESDRHVSPYVWSEGQMLS